MANALLPTLTMKKCKNEGCKGKRDERHKDCSKCRMRRKREANPIKAAFDNLKGNAKRRGKEFTITLEYFTSLVAESGYMEGKGRGANDLTFDRDKNELGYVPGNIKIMIKSDNSSKGKRDDFYKDLGVTFEGDIPF